MQKDQELDQRIREKAHELWQQAGSPTDGRMSSGIGPMK